MEVIPVKNTYSSKIILITKGEKIDKSYYKRFLLSSIQNIKNIIEKMNNILTSNGVAKATREINFSNNFEMKAIIKCFFDLSRQTRSLSM